MKVSHRLRVKTVSEWDQGGSLFSTCQDGAADQFRNTIRGDDVAMPTRHTQLLCQKNQSISNREDSRRPRFFASRFPDWQRIVPILVLVGLFLGRASTLIASPATLEESLASLTEDQKKQLAVALNYSRASLYRIRKYPSKLVLIEERDKILNHLDLNGVADEEVMKLYTAVVDEISGVQIADRERIAQKDRYIRAFERDLGLNTFQIGVEIATSQFLSAARTGASSFWDHRNQAVTHEMDMWQVDKKQMESVVQKSSQFLDVSWKMAKSKKIPDKWLIRNDDLDNLEKGLRETDLAVRLRILKRMEGFMECYPPYWYYLARAQQQMNNLFGANVTYEKLVSLGSGHFRKDEMLATGLANRAIIQAFLSQPSAAETARLAMTYSTDAWQANLDCASVLQKYGHYDDAEDAVLRNLDMKLEIPQSRVALLGQYYSSDNKVKLATQLQDPVWVREIPAQVLIICAAKLGQAEVPVTVVEHLENSLKGTPRRNVVRTDFLVTASRSWNFHHAVVSLNVGEKSFSNPRLSAGSDNSQILTFESVADNGFIMPTNRGNSDVSLTIKYPDAAPIKLVLSSNGNAAKMATIVPIPLVNRQHPVYSVVAFEQNNVRFSMKIAAVPNVIHEEPMLHTTAKPPITTDEDPVSDEELKGETN